jgi:uncharacterized Tic20 family protein
MDMENQPLSSKVRENQVLNSKIRYRAMACHLLGLTWLPMMLIPVLIAFYIMFSSKGQSDWLFSLVFAIVPFVGVVMATVLVLTFWRLFRNTHAFVDLSGREITNFMISNSFYMLICVTLNVITCGVVPLEKSIENSVNSFLPYILVLEPIIFILHFLCVVIGAIQTSKGRIYHYPFSIRFFRVST